MRTKLVSKTASGRDSSRLGWLVLLLCIGILFTFGLASGGVNLAQDQDDPPPRGAVAPAEAKPRNNQIGRLRAPIPIMELNSRFNQSGMSYSKSTRNGITTTQVKEADLEIKIEETPDGIFMEIGRSYTRDDLDQLRSSHPELATALEAFPTAADGYDVQLSVRAVKKYEAINEEDLKEEHPEAYEQYERIAKLTTQQGGFGIQGFGMELGMPELRPFPRIQELREQQDEMRREIEKMMERIR